MISNVCVQFLCITVQTKKPLVFIILEYGFAGHKFDGHNVTVGGSCLNTGHNS